MAWCNMQSERERPMGDLGWDLCSQMVSCKASECLEVMRGAAQPSRQQPSSGHRYWDKDRLKPHVHGSINLKLKSNFNVRVGSGAC
jgi:hypothetical protein